MRTFIMQHAMRDSLPIVPRRFRFHKQTKSDRLQVSTADEKTDTISIFNIIHSFHGEAFWAWRQETNSRNSKIRAPLIFGC